MTLQFIFFKLSILNSSPKTVVSIRQSVSQLYLYYSVSQEAAKRLQRSRQFVAGPEPLAINAINCNYCPKRAIK